MTCVSLFFRYSCYAVQLLWSKLSRVQLRWPRSLKWKHADLPTFILLLHVQRDHGVKHTSEPSLLHNSLLNIYSYLILSSWWEISVQGLILSRKRQVTAVNDSFGGHWWIWCRSFGVTFMLWEQGSVCDLHSLNVCRKIKALKREPQCNTGTV